jgi:hypothetical protein
MSFLLDKFCSFLPPNIDTTSKLQQKLLNYFGNTINEQVFTELFHDENELHFKAMTMTFALYFHKLIDWLIDW